MFSTLQHSSLCIYFLLFICISLSTQSKNDQENISIDCIPFSYFLHVIRMITNNRLQQRPFLLKETSEYRVSLSFWILLDQALFHHKKQSGRNGHSNNYEKIQTVNIALVHDFMPKNTRPEEQGWAFFMPKGSLISTVNGIKLPIPFDGRILGVIEDKTMFIVKGNQDSLPSIKQIRQNLFQVTGIGYTEMLEMEYLASLDMLKNSREVDLADIFLQNVLRYNFSMALFENSKSHAVMKELCDFKTLLHVMPTRQEYSKVLFKEEREGKDNDDAYVIIKRLPKAGDLIRPGEPLFTYFTKHEALESNYWNCPDHALIATTFCFVIWVNDAAIVRPPFKYSWRNFKEEPLLMCFCPKSSDDSAKSRFAMAYSFSPFGRLNPKSIDQKKWFTNREAFPFKAGPLHKGILKVAAKNLHEAAFQKGSNFRRNS